MFATLRTRDQLDWSTVHGKRNGSFVKDFLELQNEVSLLQVPAGSAQNPFTLDWHNTRVILIHPSINDIYKILAMF